MGHFSTCSMYTCVLARYIFHQFLHIIKNQIQIFLYIFYTAKHAILIRNIIHKKIKRRTSSRILKYMYTYFDLWEVLFVNFSIFVRL